MKANMNQSRVQTIKDFIRRFHHGRDQHLAMSCKEDEAKVLRLPDALILKYLHQHEIDVAEFTHRTAGLDDSQLHDFYLNAQAIKMMEEGMPEWLLSEGVTPDVAEKAKEVYHLFVQAIQPEAKKETQAV